MMSRTLVLELHVARLEGLLDGVTAQERFHSFVERLPQPDVALALLQEYPVLARQLVVSISHWVDFSIEFLSHLSADWKLLRAKFAAGKDPGILVDLRRGLGDEHRSGQSVLIAKFSSGFELVYKPRSLSIDLHFQELLAWLNARGDHPPFRTLNILDCGTHGWTEFIAVEPCSSAEEVERFCQRRGGT
jgi:lantibiotic modifying enzyme